MPHDKMLRVFQNLQNLLLAVFSYYHDDGKEVHWAEHTPRHVDATDRLTKPPTTTESLYLSATYNATLLGLSDKAWCNLSKACGDLLRPRLYFAPCERSYPVYYSLTISSDHPLTKQASGVQCTYYSGGCSAMSLDTRSDRLLCTTSLDRLRLFRWRMETGVGSSRDVYHFQRISPDGRWCWTRSRFPSAKSTLLSSLAGAIERSPRPPYILSKPQFLATQP